MMTSTKKIVLVALLCLAASALPAAAGGNANFLLGGRQLNDDDFWDPFDSQSVFGGGADFGRDTWPIHIEVGLMGSAKEETISGDDVTASIAEIYAGVLKLWEIGSVHPFVGGGLSAVAVEVEDGSSIDDQSAGLYVHGGIWWRIGTRFNLGLDARVLVGTDVDFGSAFVESDADYVQLGILLGWGWPRS